MKAKVKGGATLMDRGALRALETRQRRERVKSSRQRTSCQECSRPNRQIDGSSAAITSSANKPMQITQKITLAWLVEVQSLTFPSSISPANASLSGR